MTTTREWTRVKLGEVARQVSEHVQDPGEAGLRRYVGLEHLDSDEVRIERWGDTAHGTTFTRRFRPGHLLFGRRRAYQRKAAAADFDGVCSGDLIVIEADRSRLDPRLLPHIIHTDRFFELAVGTSAGSLSPRTKWEDISEFEFMLPPLDRQRGFVEVIDAAHEATRAAGVLVNRCSKLLRTDIDHELADKPWTLPLGSAIEGRPRYGVNRSSIPLTDPGTVPYIRVTDIQDDGSLNLDTMKGIPEEAAAGFELEPGDFIFTRSGSVGRTHLYRQLPSRAAFAGYCIAVRPDPSRLLPEFLEVLCMGGEYQRWLSMNTRGGVQKNLNATAIARMPIPSLGPAEQRAVVDRCDSIRHLRDMAVRHGQALAELRRGLNESLLKGGHDIQ